MNQSVGALVSSCQELIRDTGTDKLKTIMRVLNTHYYALCAMRAWPGLEDQKAYTFTGSEDNGQFLPSDVIDVTAVLDKTDDADRTYFKTDAALRYSRDGQYHWFYPKIWNEPLEDVHDGPNGQACDVNQGAVTFTAPIITADHTGEYIRFADEPGHYLLTEQYKFTPAYRGPKQDNKACVIRPRETKKLVLVNPDGDLEGATVMVYFWKYPTPLYDDSQMPLLPDTRALQLMAWIDLIGADQKRGKESQRYQDQLDGIGGREGALDKLLALCPPVIAPRVPRNRKGGIIMFGRRRG